MRLCFLATSPPQRFFDVLEMAETPRSIPPYFCISHLPLHRQLAATLLQLLKCGAPSALSPALDRAFLVRLLVHPLRIQVGPGPLSLSSEFRL